MGRWVAAGIIAVAALAVFTAPADTAPVDGARVADVGAGRRVFADNCAMCHGRDASGMMGMHPSLRGAMDRLTREGVEVTIRNGRNTSPPMPAWEGKLSDEQIDDVIAYIGSLPNGPRNFANDRGGGGMMGGSMSGTGWALFVVSVLAALLVGGIAGFAYRGRRREA
jgi:mono/diheme cytochrome c family protein